MVELVPAVAADLFAKQAGAYAEGDLVHGLMARPSAAGKGNPKLQASLAKAPPAPFPRPSS
ncbi:MAG: hypothetical protein A2X56_11615 [Nitrospirae bacterium GWC2_57_13]|nr:MAG: hypothetical protein A2072_03640 [Nitrospirae bacterium GWC1_57_7]OGW27504.1 MAG: hypothetical protein A2X56_11615 [Nitrospirae bacterium GWC2_57_13]